MSIDDRGQSVGEQTSFDLNRFVTAQSSIYDSALAEIRAKRKRTHWMWYIFPQLRGLGRSEAAVYYAIGSIDEAKAYLAHPVLGTRLIECTLAMCDGPENDVQQILGKIDAAKFQSCMTLFGVATSEKTCFANALERFFGGVRDEATMLNLSNDTNQT